MKPSICLVVGDNHTLHCGVKDYAFQLAKALENLGLSAEVLAPENWALGSLPRFWDKIKRGRFDILHLQYPSIGNRKSLGPHIAGKMNLAKGTVVTLHEYSAMPFLQRMSTHLFRWTADRLVFTTETEIARYGRSGIAQEVIHIGSNVPAVSSHDPRTPTVLYFGQIRPEKGLEEFLDLARRSLRNARPFNFQVIGSVLERRSEYYRTVRAASAPEVEWLIDLSFERIAERMAGSLAAYLPFPDGASNRRGSLLAALTNGLPVITTFGKATPVELIDVLLPAAGPDQALGHLERLIVSPAETSERERAGRSYARKFSWAEIARQHETVYRQMLSPTRASRQGVRECDASL